MTSRQKWLLWPVAALAAIVVVVLVLFDWSWLKGLVESRASAALGRQVEIAGDLDVDLSLTPTITLEQVRIANVDWGSRPNMATIERIELAVDLGSLLQGEIELPFLHVRRPDVLLETNRQGATNWKLGGPPSEGPPPIPIIRDLEVTDVALRYHEPGAPDDVTAALESVEGALPGGNTGIELRAHGTLEQQPLALTLTGGSVEQLKTEGEPYPFALEGHLGASRLTIAGSAEPPLDTGDFSAQITLRSDDPGPLLALAARRPSDLPAGELSVTLSREGQTWNLAQIDARLGESDLSGSASVDRAGEQPVIEADLHSEQLRVADARRLVDALGGGSEPGASDGAVQAAVADAKATLTAEQKEADATSESGPGALLPAIDAEVSYTVDRLTGPELALQALELHGTLKDRLPTLSLTGGGQYKGEPVRLDAQLGGAGEQSAGYPIDASLAAAGTQAEIEGALTRPAELAGLQLRFDVSSQNLDQLLALAGVTIPQLPPVELDGELTQDGQSWQLANLDGRLGESDVHGRATVTLGRPQPLITADLRSEQVRIEDVRPLLPGEGGTTGGGNSTDAVDAAIARARSALEGGAPGAGAAPGLGLHKDVLPGVDAELSYAVGRLSGPRLALTNLDLHARLKDGLPRIVLSGGGQYQDMPVEIDVQAGPTDQAAGSGAGYPIEAHIRAARTEIQVDGEIGQPATLDGVDVRIDASSQDLNDLLALANLELPQIPPFALSGHLVQDGQVWRVADFHGQFSESEIGGEITADLSAKRPFVSADLQSGRLRLSDIMAASDKATALAEEVEGTTDARPNGSDNGFISAQGLNFGALPEVDANVSFEGQSLELAEFHFDQLQFDLKLRDRVAVLDASGAGTYKEGRPASLEIHAGSEQSLKNPSARYPLEASLRAGDTLARAEGTIDDPTDLSGLDVGLHLEGPNLNQLGEILQIPLPETPPYRLSAQTSHQENRWNFVALRGEVGDSDLSGDITLQMDAERPIVYATLQSDHLDFDDLGVLVGAPPGTGPQESASPQQEEQAQQAEARELVLPTATFDVPQMRAVDARVKYTAQEVEAAKLPLEGVTLELRLEDGVMTVKPLRFDLADGKLEATGEVNGQTDVISGQIDLTAREIRLNKLLSGFDVEVADIEVEKEGVGTLGGRANLQVNGNSIHDMAASADGELLVIMDGGKISSLILEGIGLDVGELVTLLFSDDGKGKKSMVPVQCFVSRFQLQDGVMETKALVLDTADSTITGRGQIDLGEETLSLELVAHPKDPSVLTASTPVRIDGTFKHPKIDVISQQLAEKSLAALALGVVMPVIGAVIPFIEKGETKDTNCGRLIASNEAAVRGADGSPSAQ